MFKMTYTSLWLDAIRNIRGYLKPDSFDRPQNHVYINLVISVSFLII